MEERQGAVKRSRGTLRSAERAVQDAHAAVQHMGALDAAVGSLLSSSRKGAALTNFLQAHCYMGAFLLLVKHLSNDVLE